MKRVQLKVESSARMYASRTETIMVELDEDYITEFYDSTEDAAIDAYNQGDFETLADSGWVPDPDTLDNLDINYDTVEFLDLDDLKELNESLLAKVYKKKK